MIEKGQIKVSVIVPVYNSQKTLAECIDTITSQTLKAIEILIIDDGSIDNSLDIMHELAKNDSRITIFSKQNGGQSTARNLGLANAKGDFVAFVDSDDTIKPDMLELLYKNAIDENAEMSICGAQVIKNGVDVSPKNDIESKLVFSKKQGIEMMLAEKYILFSVCDKLYKRSTLKGIKFEEGVIHEDILFPYEILKKCEKIVCEMIPKYVYTLNDKSTTGKAFSKARLFDITARERLAADVIKTYPELYKNSLNIKLVGYLNMANKLVGENKAVRNEFLKPIIKSVRSNFFEYISCGFINKNKKIGVLLLCMGSHFYKLGLKVKGNSAL